MDSNQECRLSCSLHFVWTNPCVKDAGLLRSPWRSPCRKAPGHYKVRSVPHLPGFTLLPTPHRTVIPHEACVVLVVRTKIRRAMQVAIARPHLVSPSAASSGRRAGLLTGHFWPPCPPAPRERTPCTAFALQTAVEYYLGRHNPESAVWQRRC